MTYLKLSLLSFTLAAFMVGCSTESDEAPLVPEIVSIEIDGTDINSTIHSIVIDEDQDQLYATVLYDDNTSSTVTSQLDWDSNDSDVVSVHNGLLTPTANGGAATISASYRDKLFTTVDKNVTIIALTDTNITSEQDINITIDDTNTSLYHLDMNTTGEYTFQANGTFEDNKTTLAISSNITWMSSNTSVATVELTTGIVNVIATGTTDINVSVFSDINKTLRMDVNITE